jgi:hypothetical protein
MKPLWQMGAGKVLVLSSSCVVAATIHLKDIEIINWPRLQIMPPETREKPAFLNSIDKIDIMNM